VLLAAGFHVGSGAATGPKQETTRAWKPPVPAEADGSLLGAAWLERWRRSGGRYPPGSDPEQQTALARAVTEHPQFAGITVSPR
jgi:hypothetical protein